MRRGIHRSPQRGLACAALVVAALAAFPAAAEEVALDERAERGPVKVRVRLSPAEPKFGDVLTLELSARAEPGVDVLMPEFGEALARFAIVDFRGEEGVEDDGSRVWTQHYRLEVERSGPAAIPPLLVEFRDGRPDAEVLPPGEDAFWLESPRLDFQVASVLPVSIEAGLTPLPEALGPREAEAVPAWMLWGAGGAVALAVALGVWFAARMRQRSVQVDAYDQALQELSHLRAGGWPSADRIGDYYVELSGILRRYLEGRFDLRSPELTTEEFLEAAAASRVLGAERRERLHDFLARADLVKFAGLRPESREIQASVAAVERFIEDTRPVRSDEASERRAPTTAGEIGGGGARV